MWKRERGLQSDSGGDGLSFDFRKCEAVSYRTLNFEHRVGRLVRIGNPRQQLGHTDILRGNSNLGTSVIRWDRREAQRRWEEAWRACKRAVNDS